MAIAAWVAIAWDQATAALGGAAGHLHDASPAALDTQWFSAVAAVGLMPMAMMLPLALGGIRHAYLSTFWARRHRAACLFVLGYLAPWTVTAAALSVSIVVVSSAVGLLLATCFAFAGAVGWQYVPAKRRALRRCNRRISVPGDSWGADVACLRNGLAAGTTCVMTCWAIMAAAAAGHHSLPMMAALFAVQLHERRAWRYRPMPTAAWIVALGAIAVGTAAVT